jgi:two-component system LytT family response regulator
MYLKAGRSYTSFRLDNSEKVLVTKRLAEFECLKKISSFMRIHRSHIINYNKISKILRHAGGSVVMDNDDELSISSDKKNILLEKFGESRF